MVPFDAPAARESAVAGGKGANLARLVAADLPVPEGFCVTTTAYLRATVLGESVSIPVPDGEWGHLSVDGSIVVSEALRYRS